MHLPRFALASVLLFTVFARAADQPAAKDGAKTEPQDRPKTREEAFERAGVKLVKGPAAVQLGKVAELKLPAGSSFCAEDSLDRFYELTENMRNGKEVRVVMAPAFMLFFDYDDIGYVKDEEKDKLDGDK